MGMIRKTRQTTWAGVAGTLLTMLVATPASSQTLAPASAIGRPGPVAETVVETFVDGGRRVAVVRLGTEIVDHTGVMAVRLRYPTRPGAFVAGVDRHAIVQIGASAARPTGAIMSDLGLKPVRVLMQSLGLWLVEDAAETADGLELAVRLAPSVRPGGELRQAIPDLYLEHELRGMTPNDPRYPDQWYFSKLRMPDAWALSMGSADTTIVVIDNGCDLNHPDLATKMDTGKDVVTPDDDPSYVPGVVGNAHGTECSGIIAAVTNNDLGIAGGCPECRLRCVRLLSAPTETVPVSADVDSFQFAFDVGAAVVSNSWGFVDHVVVPQPLADAINQVFDNGRGGKGALVVFAAGNDGREIGDDELEAVRGVLCISAVNNYDEATQFTNFGAAVDLAAPAGTVTTDISGPEGSEAGDYTTGFGGTSSACPVVSGIAGLLVSAAPEKTSAELYDILTRTARRAPNAAPDANGHDPTYGFGIVNPVGALEDALGLDVSGEPTGSAPDASRGGCGCREISDSAVWLLLAVCGPCLARRRNLGILTR